MQGKLPGLTKKNQVMVWCITGFVMVVTMMSWKPEVMKSMAEEESCTESTIGMSVQKKDKAVFLTDGQVKLQDPFHLKKPQEEKVMGEALTVKQPAGSRKVPKVDFLLTGIAQNAAERIAIIENGKKSGLYKEHEKIGAYEVARITEDTVVLLKGRDDYIELRVMRE